MTALKTLGIFCIVLVCFAPVTTLIVDVFQKTRATKLDKYGKRELKINRISFWEYLIIVIPCCLLLIGLLTNDREEKLISYTILGIGYSYLLLSPYNNRIDIPWVNKTVLITSLILAIVSYLLSLTNYNYEFQSGLSCLTTISFPFATYIYLFIARQIIKITTNTYPLTLNRELIVGSMSNRYKRRANYWDLTWTLWNIGGFPGAIIYILTITK